MALTLALKITADAKQAVSEISGMVGKVTNTIKGITAGFAQVGLAIQGVKATIGAVIGAVQEYVNASMAAEASVRKLEFALASVGAGTEENKAKFYELGNELQRLAGVSNEAVLDVQSLLIQMGVGVNDLDRTTRAALDLSQAMGIDLNTAARMLGVTLSGQAGMMTRLVPQVRSLTSEQLLAGGAIDLVAEKFRGAAEAMGMTAEGALKRAQESFGDLKERIGSIITQSPAFIAVLDQIMASLDAMLTQPGEFAGALGEAIAFVINAASAVKAAWDLILSAIRTTFFAFMGYITTVAEKVFWVGNAVGLVSEQTYDTANAMRQAALEGIEENAMAAVDATKRFADAIQGKSEMAIEFESRVAGVTSKLEEGKARMRELNEARATAARMGAADAEEVSADRGAAAVEDAEARKRDAIKATIDAAQSAAQQEASLLSRGFQLVGGGAFGSTLVNPATGEVQTVAGATGGGGATPGGGGSGGGTQVVNVQAGTVFGGGMAAMRDSATDLGAVQGSVSRISGPKVYFWG